MNEGYVTNMDELRVRSFNSTLQKVAKKPLAGSLRSKPGNTWVADLPLIICGPILRKVYYDHVSVWLAFKEEVSDITLKIFDAKNKSNVILSGIVQSPLMLGNNLFVTLVTAVSTGKKLSAGNIYGYGISFRHSSRVMSLKDAGVLKGGIQSVAYRPFDFPSFCLPADHINHLKITHGSCRKPHGGTTDALRALDTMIEINSTDSSQRPQLLCLTGDQIYADDVSDILLHKIIKAQHSLLGWKEALPKSYNASQLLPGNRKDIIAKTGNKNTRLGFVSRDITADDLTTTDADNHLIFFSEFLLMYLFAFSDVLWSDGTLTFRPKHIDHKIKLGSFLKALPYVRKALANISVLMIFDDHDITDDWFITKRWSEVALLKGTTSRRYIFNGMMAYAIFQDWGNDYLKYQSGDGLAILNALNLKDRNSYLSNVSAYPNKQAAAIESIVLPEVVRDNSNIADASWYLKNRMRWDYRVDYNSFTLFVLNTRTERQYYDKEKQVPNLIKSIHTNISFTQNRHPNGR